MATFDVQGLTKRFGDVLAVSDFTLKASHGEFVALLGPSGCGKSTILRMVAGLAPPDAGRIQIDGQDVTWQPPHRREIGLVFQSYALFPHMSVFENVAFGLRQRRVGEAGITARVREALELVRLPGLERRMPRELSGGQQQRVALARAIAPRPALLLLDEPLSNLDAKLRDTMRVEIRRLQQELAITTLFVTHDQEEALTMSDRICVLNQGVLQQVGTPREIYDHPTTAFVAEFFGRSNIFEGRLISTSGCARILLDDGLEIKATQVPAALRPGDHVRVAIRQESIVIAPERLEPMDNSFGGRLELVSFAGGTVQYVVQLGTGTEITAAARTPRGRELPRTGTEVHVGWAAGDVIVTGQP